MAGILYAERRKWDTKSRLLASVDRVRELIGYEPNTPFEKGMKNTIAWFRENWDLIEAAARFGPGISIAVRKVGASQVESLLPGMEIILICCYIK
ncbi:MAG: hypothetical protein PHU44_13510 [Syntrophales bacterium]|nr:hypothetical protein [Syntrophales bacterium]MDD5641901.1 hypothetical protein [Syntrophales bacterium]